MLMDIARLSLSSIFFFFYMNRKKKEAPQQTDPPSIPVVDLFPYGDFPEGEIQQYKDE